jgi:hypothetical protein
VHEKHTDIPLLENIPEDMEPNVQVMLKTAANKRMRFPISKTRILKKVEVNE